MKHKKDFQLKVNRPLADRCMGYKRTILNRYGGLHVGKGGGTGGVNNFEQVHSGHMGILLVNRQTD